LELTSKVGSNFKFEEEPVIRTILFSILLFTVAISAQIPYGKEFQVNTYWQGSQMRPFVAGLAHGGFVACWESLADQDGQGPGIFAQRYSVDGNSIGDEFQVNTYWTYNQDYPFVASLVDGGFVVCWQSGGQDGSGVGIFAQRYAADGMTIGLEIQVNSFWQAEQSSPSVAGLEDGGFIACWNSWEQDGSEWGVFGQRYGADGMPEGGEFQVNTYWQKYQMGHSLAALRNNGFVVCWTSDSQDGSKYGIFAQCYDKDGNPKGGEFQVNTYWKDFQANPTVAGLDDGGFVACWESYGQDGDDYGIFGQRYGAEGVPVGSEFQVNTHWTYYQDYPFVTSLVDGGFVVCWQSGGQDGSGGGIFARCYNSDGKPVGNEFQVNTYRRDDQRWPSVAALSDGSFVMCWQSVGQDGEGCGIFAKRFPAEPQRHELRPFDLLQPEYDATVTTGKPTLNWQLASELIVAYPWEMEYTASYDTLADFSTAARQSAGPDTTLKLPALNLGKTYFWKVLVKTYYGDSLWSDVGAFFVSPNATGVEAEEVPRQFAVLSNYPNPFNPSTTLRFELPKDGCVTLKIYDLSGRLVKVLLSGNQTAGAHTAVWDGTDDAGHKVAAGVYFYRLEFTDANGTRQVLTQKMSLVK
jgi:hypothetical protein